MGKEIFIILVKRILSSALILLLLITFLFFLLRISPGDPSLKFLSPEMNPRLASLVRESFGLNGTLTYQYKYFLLNLLTGNLGISYTYRIPVTEVIGQYLPFTLMFSFTSFLIQIIFAFILAIISFKNLGDRIDKILTGINLLLYAIPSFVIGVALIFIFSEQLKLFPASGLTSIDNSNLSFISRMQDYISHMVLPLVTLSVAGTAEFYKYIRDNLEVINLKPFIENLRASGIGENEITWKHIIPNAINPLISVAGVELGLLLGGALITEVIFGLPGMGRLTVNAIFSRDYPLIVGCTFVSGILIILSNILADFARAVLDKRIVKGILN